MLYAEAAKKSVSKSTGHVDSPSDDDFIPRSDDDSSEAEWKSTTSKKKSKSLSKSDASSSIKGGKAKSNPDNMSRSTKVKSATNSSSFKGNSSYSKGNSSIVRNSSSAVRSGSKHYKSEKYSTLKNPYIPSNPSLSSFIES